MSRFLEVYQQEHARTMKVLRAYPADQAEFKPHERSNTALRLAATFFIEGKLMLLAIKGEPVLGSGGFPAAPQTWDEILEGIEQQSQEIVRLLGNGEPTGVVPFYTGPKQMGEYTAIDFLWFLLHDQIHHRGQLTVYLRMAGGKVPAVYGPSADEPWN